jgi:hypothetical protein
VPGKADIATLTATASSALPLIRSCLQDRADTLPPALDSAFMVSRIAATERQRNGRSSH